MAARVRFATGLWLQYNSVKHLTRHDGYTDLRDTAAGDLIAQVPTAACVIEFHRPCEIGWSKDFVTAREVTQRVSERLTEVQRRRTLAAKRQQAKRKRTKESTR